MAENNRFEFLKHAFKRDGFNVKDFWQDPVLKKLRFVNPDTGCMDVDGKLGLLEEHRTAVNTVTGEPKRVYYVEGSHRQMGMLLGLMATPQVHGMVTEFAENIVLSFFASDTVQSLDSSFFDKLKEMFVELIGEATEAKIGPDVPPEYKDEMEGIYDGCKEVDPSLKDEKKKKEFMEKIWAINFGHDLLMAHVYTGERFAKQNIPPFLLRVPIMCNAISLSGDVVAGGTHYFGRDFMFPTANVFQDTACLIISNPESEGDKKYIPTVSQTAPGMFGSMAAMNLEGVAIGVDMNPTKFCNPGKPGLNSLALNRDCLEHSANIRDAVNHIIDAPRGVSWLYPLADGKSDTACIVEAGCNIGDDPFPYFDYVSPHFKDHLQKLGLNEAYILKQRNDYKTPAPQKGLMARWGDYNYPMNYITDFNREMWHLFNTDFWPKFEDFLGGLFRELLLFLTHRGIHNKLKTIFNTLKDIFAKVSYSPMGFGERGYINITWKGKSCPGPYYFAPQREGMSNVSIVSNHNITPEMRLTAMSEWVALVGGSEFNDIQWRYDEMNDEVLRAVAGARNPDNPRLIDKDMAWRLINFLSPEPGYNFPGYRNPDGSSWKTKQVHGSISLFDLKEKKIKSSFGYYGDETIEVTLPNYIMK